MIRSASFLSVILMILISFVLFNRLTFLAPQKRVLFSHCGTGIALYLFLLALNLFAAVLTINRKLLLKDTGRKLSHFDNHLQTLKSTGNTNPLNEVQ
ncbi:MAG: hypothetical protein WAK20_20965 [Candidatus Acidiferrum sp.]